MKILKENIISTHMISYLRTIEKKAKKMKKTYKNVKRTTTASGFNKNNRYKNNPYEKISFSHLGQQNLKNNKGRSPAQSKARDVIRKYKMQLRKLEFKRLKKLVPSMQNTSDEESNEVISNYFVIILVV